jgi:hypothetical protein
VALTTKSTVGMVEPPVDGVKRYSRHGAMVVEPLSGVKDGHADARSPASP